MKKGQVTIFIVVGVIIIVGILIGLFFLGDMNISSTVSDDPRVFIKSCVEDSVEESLNKMLNNGGEILPSLAISYQGKEWNYLCHSADYYLGCYNLHPMLESQIENQIIMDTSEDIKNCFDSMREEFEDRGYDVSGGATEYSIDLLPGYVDIKLNKQISVSNKESALEFDDFGFEIISSIYDLVEIARLVSNDESQFCNFEYNGYMLLYPQFDIRRIDYRDSKLYRIKDRNTKEEFRMAIRSCAMPPGI